MSEEIKQITLTGVAAAEMGGAHQGKKERVKRRTGGEQNASSAQVQPQQPSQQQQQQPQQPQQNTVKSVMKPVSNTSKPVHAVHANNVINLSHVVNSNTPQPGNQASHANNTGMEGGTKVIKVELKKRSTAKRVHLQPKKVEVSKGKPQPQTKKARKVTLAVSALHKRMSRAKKMTRKVKEMSLPQLREHLIQKKLIKPTSKAPEPILRQIAADASIVAGKAL